MDLVAGLHWLRENLPAFNGNPNMVTLMGHGHGAALANILIVSPVASGMLFYSNFSTLFFSSFHCIVFTAHMLQKMSERVRKCIYEKLLFFICSNMHRKRKLQCQGIKM